MSSDCLFIGRPRTFYKINYQKFVKHFVRVFLEKIDDGSTVDDDAGDHEDEDGDVSPRKIQAQFLLSHLSHPRFESHLESFFRSKFRN